MFAESLPSDMVEKILFVPSPSICDTDDTFLWRHSPDGTFSTKSACLAMKKPLILEPIGNFSLAWA